LTGKIDKCEDCATAKAKKKNIPKTLNKRSKKTGERLFIDISSVKTASYGGRKYWALIIDDASDYCWSYFSRAKKHLGDKVTNLIRDLKAKHKVCVTTILVTTQERIFL